MEILEIKDILKKTLDNNKARNIVIIDLRKKSLPLSDVTSSGLIHSFPILYASKKIVDILLEDGFWFLNSKFYNPKSDNLHDSVLNTMSYLRDLKSKIGSNLGVHEYLMGIYQNKLENQFISSKKFIFLLEN